MTDLRTRPMLRRSLTLFVLIGGIAGGGLAFGRQLSYEDARIALRSVSDARKAGEAGVNRSEQQARAADSLGTPEVSLSATQVFGVKTDTLHTPIGPINIDENFNGPRSSINSTWSIYSGGRITATQRALAAGVDQARAELTATDEQLNLELAQVY